MAVGSLECASGNSGGASGAGGGSSGAPGAGGGSTGGVPSGAAGTATVGAAGTAGDGTAGETAGASGASSGTSGAAGSADGGAADTRADGTAGAGGTAGAAGTSGAAGASSGAGGSVNAFDGPVLYTAMNTGTMYAYKEGTWAQIGMWTGVPITDAARGIDADAKTGILYMTHGGAGPASNGPKKNGSLLAWSLLQNKVVFDVQFTHGVDQPSVGDGVVYVPSGEYTNDRNWYYVSAVDGKTIGSEPGGMGPHDTIFRNGHRYYGGTQDTYLYVFGLPITKVGPSPSATAGVRPYTLNAAETRAYITWSAFRGFSVADLTTGTLLKTVKFGADSCLAAPSHGMSLSPDGKEVWVLDTCMNQVRVYDSSDDPQIKATITFDHAIHPGTENPCVWDCDKDGWITHSRNGKYVYIGDGGDVIDTATRRSTTYIPNLANTRHGFIEVDWSNGTIIGTPSHVGMGW
ncbi:MAG TPA: hypothetical protein VGK52_02110 [Polyangia bacterium]